MEDAGLNTTTQIELNKKKTAQLAEIKLELEESNIAFEGTLAALRSKHNNNMSDLGEQIDGLNKKKQNLKQIKLEWKETFKTQDKLWKKQCGIVQTQRRIVR